MLKCLCHLGERITTNEVPFERYAQVTWPQTEQSLLVLLFSPTGATSKMEPYVEKLFAMLAVPDWEIYLRRVVIEPVKVEADRKLEPA
jgi:hypothetical protein